MDKILDYSYSDGNGNIYLIQPNRIKYKPIKPIHSSSGIYSGGEYRKVEITPEDYKKIDDILKKAIQNKSAHTEFRVMMSSTIRYSTSKEKKNIILEPNSEEQKQIEELLKKILN
jgi:hypothetical protein